jgi:sec-independent protein translocase protein TatA
MELFSIQHLLLLLVIVVILFGGRKIPELMRGLGEGVRGFKEGMSGNPPQPPPPPVQTSATQPPAEEKKA